jgi:hypothetical protein
MRLLIYLLAMLTGFSAAEAARPVTAVPASVGAPQTCPAYAADTAKTVVQLQYRPLVNVLPSAFSVIADIGFGAFFSISPTTPILRHDLILG